MKYLEYFALVLRSDSDAGVFDRVNRAIAFQDTGDADNGFALQVTILESVIEKIGKHLVDLGRVTNTRGQLINAQRCFAFL